MAGKAFGPGSSREQAPRALQKAGIRAVIVRSFAFIYGGNQAYNGLLGIRITDDEFYELADEGEQVDIDVTARLVRCKGQVLPI